MNNNKLVKFTLKTGENITVSDNDKVYLIGKTEWTRLTSQYTTAEIEVRNERKAIAAARLNMVSYPEDVNRPYTEVVISGLKFISKENYEHGRLNAHDAELPLEKYIADCCYLGTDGKGLKFSVRNHDVESDINPDPTPPITWVRDFGVSHMKGSELPGEFPQGTTVILETGAYITDDDKIELSLDDVVILSEPQYIITNNRRSNASAMARLFLDKLKKNR